MRILEVRDGFIKFESEKRFVLSSFVEVKDLEKNYIAQVVQTKRAGEISIIYAKFLFINDGELFPYDLTLPSNNSEIAEFSYEDLSKNFAYKSPIVVGPFCNSDNSLKLEKACFNKKLLVSIDESQTKLSLIPNIAKQFDKFLIIDTLGIYNGNKYLAGVDFKLPLNSESLQFMFEDCLNDATTDSKNLIKEIFQDLADYSKTVPFLPFGALKTIVDDMVEKSHVFKLLVLKNKLAKFDKLGYFATTIDEAQNLNKILEKNCVIDLSKLDATFQNRYLSVILSSLQKQNIESQLFIEVSNSVSKKNLKALLTRGLKTTLVTNSRFRYLAEIKSMFANFIISPSFANNSMFKTFATFLNAMQKDSCLVIGENTNYIPFVSSTENLEVFFNKLLDNNIEELEDSLKEDSIALEEVFIEDEVQDVEIAEEKDESILAIEKKSEDLINKVSEEIKNEDNSVELNLFEEENDSEEFEKVEEIIEDSLDEISETENFVVEESLQEESLEPQEILEEDLEDNLVSLEESIPESKEEYHTQVDEIQTIEISEDISELTEEAELIQEEVAELENVGSEEVLETQTYSAEVEFTQEPMSIIPISDNTEEFDEIIELDDSDLSEPDIVVEFEDEDLEQLEPEDLDKAIIEDVDKVFTTMKEDSISDSDLDFIDELNGNLEEDSSEEVVLSEGMEELTELQELDDAEEGFIEPLEEINENDFNGEEEQKEILETRTSSTPMVPVYEAEIPQEDIVTSDPIEQGDTVVHAKYGNGVVEKMIKYGAKILYSINFDNVGRRLLDPTLTEIKKY